jgi:hypothetical protein
MIGCGKNCLSFVLLVQFSMGSTSWCEWSGIYKSFCWRSKGVHITISRYWNLSIFRCINSPCYIHECDNRRTVFSMWSAPWPLLCNGAVNTSTTIEGLCFLRGLCQDVILKTIGATVLLQNIRQTVNDVNTSWRTFIVKLRYQETASENTAEEKPLLRAVTKQWLVITDSEDLAWKSAIVL